MEYFHPLIQRWFKRKFGNPTDVQQQSWPLIRDGNHLLTTAPTGSGKTLTAFLWSINQLFSDIWSSGKISVLYISPLKALNNDIQHNLLRPLSELDRYFEQYGETQKEIHVAVRSGDTPQNERRRMLRNPPEILITTPESLNNLLTSQNGRLLFTNLKTVILDEIHAVVGSKRGTHLITAVDRLVEFSGEFQRIALSATVKPLKRIAEFVGGYQMVGTGNATHYQPRPVSIVKISSEKKYDIQVDFPMDTTAIKLDKSVWPSLIIHLKKAISTFKATLFFANSRRLTEKITRLLNENEAELLAYAHHGSLAKELRLAVEQKLKMGELKAIVATSSLELGIDVGNLDMVGLVQTPMSVAASVQRVGRAGHSVGETSKGVIYPLFGLDLVCAAAMAKAVTVKDVEEILPVEAPLDVLTQIILSMICHEKRHLDDLYALIKTSYPYRNLSRKQFDLVIAMLEGYYADVRIKELTSKISIDRLSGMVQAKKGTAFLLYLAGGTIPDRGYFNLRLDGTGDKIGELDEEFVWERSIGDVFALGSRVWQVKSITHNDMMVAPATGKWDIIPFWKAENQNRHAHFSEKMAVFLEWADENIDGKKFSKELIQNYFMTPSAAEQLTSFLRLQKETTQTALPHRHHLVVEHVDMSATQTDTKQIILHTLWGGGLNRPFALALSSAWEEEYNSPLQVFADNDGVVLLLPNELEFTQLFELVTSSNVESLLIRKLEQTGLFGAFFRENAGRALLLPKQNFKKRMPLWLNRLRAKKLHKSVQTYDDFPILIETFRTCLQDEFDLVKLKERLQEIRNGKISISNTYSTTNPSPFASSLVYRQTDMFMYSDDTPLSNSSKSLKNEYIQELIKSSHLRPRLSDDLLITFEKKIQRSLPGYAPENETELLDWLKERLMLPFFEWEELLKAMELPLKNSFFSSNLVSISWSGHGPFIAPLEVLPRFSYAFSIDLNTCHIKPISSKGKRISETQSNNFKTTSLEKISQIHRFSYEENESPELALVNFMDQWIGYYGPIHLTKLQKTWGLDDETIKQVIEQLVETNRAMVDIFSQSGQTSELCASENLERLFYLHRQWHRPAVNPLPLSNLPLFVAQLQGVGQQSDDINALQSALERLFGLPLPVNLWEEIIWPSRLKTYFTKWMDRLLQTSDLVWLGCGEKKVAFAFSQDIELFLPPFKDDDISPLPSPTGKFNLFDVASSSKLNSEQTTRLLWEKSWQGKISNDSFEVIRKGIHHKFKPEPTSKINQSARARSRFAGRRGSFNRWQSSRPLSGNWFSLPKTEEPDPVETEEIARERVRQLLKRYGILFRQLLTRELPMLQWASIFKTLRLMEFSGEVVCGRFFKSISGLQFASKEALTYLQQPLLNEKIFWLNAADPASLCGIDLPELKGKLPARQVTTFLVYQGDQLNLIAKRNGKKLEVNISPDHPRLQEHLNVFNDLLNRNFNPLKKISIETVNEKNVLNSKFLPALKEFGFEESFNCVELWKKF
ncbi:MAG: DEAD/DEAH box helicase [Desulfobacteraceae bacterium]|jgi:ATP-dependent Lhr-like helicase